MTVAIAHYTCSPQPLTDASGLLWLASVHHGPLQILDRLPHPKIFQIDFTFEVDLTLKLLFKFDLDVTLLCCPGHQANEPCHSACSSHCTSPVSYLVKGCRAVQAPAGGHTHFHSSAYVQEMRQGWHVAVQALAGCLPTQLIAVACLARLCTQVNPCHALCSSAHLAYSGLPLPPFGILILHANFA